MLDAIVKYGFGMVMLAYLAVIALGIILAFLAIISMNF